MSPRAVPRLRRRTPALPWTACRNSPGSLCSMLRSLRVMRSVRAAMCPRRRRPCPSAASVGTPRAHPSEPSRCAHRSALRRASARCARRPPIRLSRRGVRLDSCWRLRCEENSGSRLPRHRECRAVSARCWLWRRATESARLRCYWQQPMPQAMPGSAEPRARRARRARRWSALRAIEPAGASTLRSFRPSRALRPAPRCRGRRGENLQSRARALGPA